MGRPRGGGVAAGAFTAPSIVSLEHDMFVAVLSMAVGGLTVAGGGRNRRTATPHGLLGAFDCLEDGRELACVLPYGGHLVGATPINHELLVGRD